MPKEWIFDSESTRVFSERRAEYLKRLIQNLRPHVELRSALDAGCGIGYFSGQLAEMNFEVTAIDARQENIDEAKQRYTGINFVTLDAEDQRVPELGSFDMVLCFGLLYHLENPFLAIRNLFAVTKKVLIIETIVTSHDLPMAALVDEYVAEDQSIHAVAFIPSEPAFIKMLYRSGFVHVYTTAHIPEHEQFFETDEESKRRTIIVASQNPITADMLSPAGEIHQREWSRKRRSRSALPFNIRDAIHNPRNTVKNILPGWLYGSLRTLKEGVRNRAQTNILPRNLLGDRDVENSWVTSQMTDGGGEALDFGSGRSVLGFVAAQRGYNVTALNLEPVDWMYVHPNLRFVQGDVLTTDFPDQHFDLIINCSTVEHVGLAGRYGVNDSRLDGDLEAMTRLSRFLKKSGMMLLTIPVGRDAVFAPMCRVYGEIRLPLLLAHYQVLKEQYWVKNDSNRWEICDKDTALKYEALASSSDAAQCTYALGCFVLSLR